MGPDRGHHRNTALITALLLLAALVVAAGLLGDVAGAALGATAR